MTRSSPVQWRFLMCLLEADWARPFLAEAGVPAEVVADLDGILASRVDVVVEGVPRSESPETVGQVLGLLAAIEERHGVATRDAFENWARLSLTEDATTHKAFIWTIVLRDWIRAGKPNHRCKRAPDAIVAHRALLEPWLDTRRADRLQLRLDRVAPRAPEDMGGGMSFDALALFQAATNCWTWRALAALYAVIDDAERTELARQAEAYAQQLGLHNTRDLDSVHPELCSAPGDAPDPPPDAGG